LRIAATTAAMTKFSREPQRTQPRALLRLVSVHPLQDVVQRTNRRINMWPLVEHYACGAVSQRGIGDLCA
jgi:hypothetical protein